MGLFSCERKLDKEPFNPLGSRISRLGMGRGDVESVRVTVKTGDNPNSYKGELGEVQSGLSALLSSRGKVEVTESCVVPKKAITIFDSGVSRTLTPGVEIPLGGFVLTNGHNGNGGGKK